MNLEYRLVKYVSHKNCMIHVCEMCIVVYFIEKESRLTVEGRGIRELPDGYRV